MKIALIAGEASGDRLGGRLMAALHDSPHNIAFSGIGGVMMEAQGLRSLFDMQELSLMGFAEVLPHARRLTRRIHETVAFIERERPDVLVTIDSPGFTFRVVKKLRGRGKARPRLIHYVAPTVWAYKPQRAAKTAALFDELLVLLPFEPPFFEREGLATHFIGHPVTEDEYRPAEAKAFRTRRGIAEGEPLLCVMPGSRHGELSKLLPVFTKALRQMDVPLRLVIPATVHSAALLERLQPHWPSAPIMVTDEAEKRAAMLASDFALAKSGTVTLEAAMAGLPMITAYKVNSLSAWLLRQMITTRYVNLINILMEREVIPEYLQQECAPEILATALSGLAKNQDKRAAQKRDYAEALRLLSSPQIGKSPSQLAAEVVLGASSGKR